MAPRLTRCRRTGTFKPTLETPPLGFELIALAADLDVRRAT